MGTALFHLAHSVILSSPPLFTVPFLNPHPLVRAPVWGVGRWTVATEGTGMRKGPWGQRWGHPRDAAWG